MPSSRRRLAGATALAALLAAGAFPAVAASHSNPKAHRKLSLAASGPPSFTSSTVATQQFVGEPRAVTDPGAGVTYVVAPPETLDLHVATVLWRSTDGGATFAGPVETNGGGGDSDLAFDSNHVVYVADLFGAGGTSIPISVSTDHGATFSSMTLVAPNAGPFDYDRHWIATTGAGHLVVIAHNENTGNEDAWTSTDGAKTFSPPTTAATDISVAGPLVTSPASPSTVYFAYLDGSGHLNFASSTNGGSTWTSGRLIAALQDSVLFPVMTVDGSGTLYAAWSGIDPVSQNDDVVMFSRSTDGGGTWLKPVAVSDNATDPLGDAPAAVFPWIVAGATAGHVDISYVQSTGPLVNPVLPDLGDPTTTWDLHVAQSLNANTTATFTKVTAAPDFHTGSICTQGLACPETGVGNVPRPFDRRDLDFLGATLDGSGNVFVPYPKDRPVTGGYVGDLCCAWIDLMLARQTGGQTL